MEDTNKKFFALIFIVLLFFSTGCSIHEDSEQNVMFKVTLEHIGGKVVADPSLRYGKALKDSEVTFTAEPDNPQTHEIDKWEITGGQKLAGGENGSKSVKVKIIGNTHVKVTFKEKPPAMFNVTLEHVGGKITAVPPLKDGKAVKDSEITFTAEPDNPQTHETDRWKVSGGEVLEGWLVGNKIVKIKITEDTTIKVSFCKKSSFNVQSGKGNVGDVEFKMKQIEAVDSASLGHNDEADNKPHTASLSKYLICETEVTQNLFEQVMGINPSRCIDKPIGSEIKEERPAEMVSWYRAIAFCNKLSIRIGLEPCYTVEVAGTPIDFENLAFYEIPRVDNADWNAVVMDMSKKGFRLPTEAEWEWAAKGGQEYKWAGTDDKNEVIKYAWYDKNSLDTTHQVAIDKESGINSANGYGLYDMSGNVWEWCWNWYENTTPADGQKDPVGVDSGTRRVMRGGSWYFDVLSAACSYKNYMEPNGSNSVTGFRFVCRP